MRMLNIKINVIIFKKQNCNNIMTGNYVHFIKAMIIIANDTNITLYL